MTQFERVYNSMRPHRIAIEYADGRPGEVADMTSDIQKQKAELQMLLQYRELDRMALELEKEIQAVKALRMEMEKYKAEFSLLVKDDATKQIREVFNEIDKLIK